MMKNLTEMSIEQVIPQPTPELKSFVGCNIQLLGELDRERYVDEKVDENEPLISVSNGDRNYIYSFTKAVEAIDKEILSIKSNFHVLIMIAITFGLLSALTFAMLATTHGRIPEMAPIFASVLGALSIFSIVSLIIGNHRKDMKELRSKKTLVFSFGQDYIKTKKEEYKKPVVVI